MAASLVLLALLAPPGVAARSGRDEPVAAVDDPAARLHATLPTPLGALVGEILARNPDLARARAAAEAADLRPAQVRALPDPMASLTAFLSSPETRVGPQRASATISQRLPWFGKLRLKEQQALLRAAAARLEVDARRLELVTEARRLAWELAYLEAEEAAVRTDRDTLSHFETLARARYSSGVGLAQAVIKLQAEITRDDERLLRVAKRRADLRASLNALRDRSAGEPLPRFELSEPPAEIPPHDPDELVAVADAHRPEVARSRLLIDAAQLGIRLAEKEYRPDLSVGLGYTLVGERDDPAGRAMPPAGNGDDIIGLTIGLDLPVWRESLAAGVLEATALETAAGEGLRSLLARIGRDLGDLTARLPLTLDQLALFEDLLLIQAEEALRSAEAAYASGSQSALDLLDAERVLLDIRIASARTLADALILQARLEGALGVPVETLPGDES